MKFSKTIFFGIFSVLLLIFFIIYRKDNLLQISAAFFALIWFVQLPGTLILILSENKTGSFLRLILFGNVIGLALVPLLYYLLYFFNLHNSFDTAISCINVLLGIILVARLRKKTISLHKVDATKLRSVFLLLAVVMIICSIREFSQMLSWNFVFNSKHDTDAGTLMSMVIGLKNYGYLVNLNEGAAAVNYHHFIYLLMALVMKTSHIGILPLYQVVFPLYVFFFMTLGAYYLVRVFNVSEKIAVLSAVSLLLLDDFYLLNQLTKLLFGHQPVFTIESIAWLHNSPSTAISLFMLFVILAEASQAEKEKRKYIFYFFLVLASGTLACYKISTWACLAGGLFAAAILKWKTNRRLAVTAVLSLVAGFAVNKFLSGIASNNYSSEGMNVNIAYPVLRSEAVKNFLLFQNDILSFHDLNFKIVVVLLLLFVFYIIGVFGIRLFYFSDAIKKGLRKIDFVSAAIVFAVLGGILISFMITPSVARHNSLYFILTGMYLLSVVSIFPVYKYLTGTSKRFGKAVVAGIIAIQLGSGLLQVLQPFTNPVKGSALSTEWFEAMNYVKSSTEPNSMLAYNRFQLKENYYRDDFDFVPVFSERPVVVGGKQYFPDYEIKKLKTDSLFSCSGVDDVKRISGELKVDYMLYDKWKGGNLPCRDTSALAMVYSNRQIDVYKVKKN